jgi:predicted nucleic acid-binding protein
MIAIDSAVVIALLSNAPLADAAEQALRESLSRGQVVICDVAIAEVCSALQHGDQAMQALEDMGLNFSAIEQKSALRAGEMQRRHRAKNTNSQHTLCDFLVGAHALLQCDALITQNTAFFRDYFKGLKVIRPVASSFSTL